MRILPASILLAFLALDLEAQQWRYYAGGTATRWTARGEHGHTEACETKECDRSDWDRGNLDSAIGYRFGAARRVGTIAGLATTAGVDLAVVSTEYNLSQQDLWVVVPSASLGIERRAGLFSFGATAGLGGALTDDGRSRTTRSAEGYVDFNAHEHAAMRLGFRRAYVADARLREIAVLMQASGVGEARTGPWSFEYLFGASEPGAIGKDLALTRAPIQKNALYRDRAGRKDRIGLTWVAASHESRHRSVFKGVPGNERGKMIPSIGLTWDRRSEMGRVTLRAGGGLEVADWSDEHELLVDGGSVVEQGFDGAVIGTLSGAITVLPGVNLLVGIDHLRWASSGLGERRLFFGAGVTF